MLNKKLPTVYIITQQTQKELYMRRPKVNENPFFVETIDALRIKKQNSAEIFCR
jgi:hypothetical protein